MKVNLLITAILFSIAVYVITTKNNSIDDSLIVTSGALFNFESEKIEPICPWYKPDGANYRGCLLILVTELKNNFSGRADEIKTIEKDCHDRFVEGKEPTIAAGDDYKLCIIDKLSSSNLDLIKPVRILWIGNIISVMGSGSSYGIEKVPKDENYRYFLAERTDEKYVWLDGLVRVTGKFKGLDCEAYQTIFNGCVPYVEIEKIESVNN